MGDGKGNEGQWSKGREETRGESVHSPPAKRRTKSAIVVGREWRNRQRRTIDDSTNSESSVLHSGEALLDRPAALSSGNQVLHGPLRVDGAVVVAALVCRYGSVSRGRDKKGMKEVDVQLQYESVRTRVGIARGAGATGVGAGVVGLWMGRD
jgi:hypothetical protein